jgi:acetyl esterase/lipase
MSVVSILACVMVMGFATVLLAGCHNPAPCVVASRRTSPTSVQGHFNLAYDRFPETRLHLFVPEGQARAPLVVYLHGGGWTGGSLDQYDAHCVRTACEGLAIATVEYRFLDKVSLGEIIGDVARACAFLGSRGEEYGYDGTRMFLWGSSAGGHLALMISARWQHLRQELNLAAFPTPIGVIAQCPVTNLEKMNDAANRERGDKFVGNGKLEELSPLHVPPELFAPVQIQHGDKDDLVPLDDSRRFIKKLQEAGMPVELITLPGVGHGFGYNLASPPAEEGFGNGTRFIRERLNATP